MVLVDALRASATITVALSLGVQRVFPVESLEEARSYLSRPGFFVAGERNTVKVPGFHFGNSPTELLAHAPELKGQALVLTTSNGTRCVAAARGGAGAFLVGCLPNERVAAEAAFRLAVREGCDITLLAAGEDGMPAAEDEYTVACLAGRLAALGAESHVAAPQGTAEEAFRAATHGQKLIRLGYDEDVTFCARVNTLDIVGVLEDGSFVSRPEM